MTTSDLDPDALLPCPFCGHPPDRYEWDIWCPNRLCAAKPSVSGHDQDDRDSVSDKWNTRAAPASAKTAEDWG